MRAPLVRAQPRQRRQSLDRGATVHEHVLVDRGVDDAAHHDRAHPDGERRVQLALERDGRARDARRRHPQARLALDPDRVELAHVRPGTRWLSR